MTDYFAVPEGSGPRCVSCRRVLDPGAPEAGFCVPCQDYLDEEADEAHAEAERWSDAEGRVALVHPRRTVPRWRWWLFLWRCSRDIRGAPEDGLWYAVRHPVRWGRCFASGARLGVEAFEYQLCERVVGDPESEPEFAGLRVSSPAAVTAPEAKATRGRRRCAAGPIVKDTRARPNARRFS